MATNECCKCSLSNTRHLEICNACHSQTHKLRFTKSVDLRLNQDTIDLTGEDESDAVEDDGEVEIVVASTLSVRKRRTSNQYKMQPEYEPDKIETKTKVQKSLFGSIVDFQIRGKSKEKHSFETTPTNVNSNTSPTKKRRREESLFDYSLTDIRESVMNDTNMNYKVEPTDSTLKILNSRAMKILNNTFGIQTLRSLQPNAIECALRGQSQIVIMATGGGKSLCYQLPALTLPGMAIVVCPLIALMMDQVEGLKQKGIEAAFISSSQSEKENNIVILRLQGQKPKTDTKSLNLVQPEPKPIKLLYCTPELLQTERFRTILMTLYQQKKLSLIAIDEAHCVSTWGSDFRPAYRNLSWLRDSFPDVPCVACTATATKKVIQDIRSVLKMTNGEACHKSTFNRENIHYEVRYKESLGGDYLALQDLMSYVKQQHEIAENTGSLCNGIIYVHKRQDTTHIADMLTKIGIPSASYHAGLTKKQRNETQMEWTTGKIKVAIATVAFGMGIDLAHVRYVIHWSMPKTVEGFYQESGRAGRDGLTAFSVLYFSNDEASKYAFLIRKATEEKSKKFKTPLQNSDDRHLDELQKMVDYCKLVGCRRKYLLNHFGEVVDPKKVCRKNCDYCINPMKVIEAQESTSNARAARDVINQKFSFNNSKQASSFWSDVDDDDFEDPGPFYDTDLAITYSDQKSDSMNGNMISGPQTKTNLCGFSSAKSILENFEAKEFSTNKGGFVKFYPKKQNSLYKKPSLNDDNVPNNPVAKSSTATIPSHIFELVQKKKVSNDILPKSSSKAPCSSTSVTEERRKLQADLDAIKKRRDELLSIRSNR